METTTLQRRKLPKLMACMTKGSLENLRNKALFTLDLLDAKGIRRRKLPLHECLILELKETGFTESVDYFQDLLYDNLQLIAEDEIGIVVDLRKRNDYLEHICSGLQRAENEREKGNTKKESLEFLNLAMFFAEKGKGILWLAENFFLTSIALASQYLLDGGRQKGCCKFFYSKFLLDKFPEADTDEPYQILTEVRDESIGKKWPLIEEDEDHEQSVETLFSATAIQLHRVLLNKARLLRKTDAPRAERLCRLAERRAADAGETNKAAEAIIEIGICQLQMNSLKNALKTFQRAYKIQTDSHNVEGICEARMHLASALQRLGDHDGASAMLTDMGALAMEYGLRRHLGRALHLLGELHLRRERPELGTQYLREAFACFMGFSWQNMNTKEKKPLQSKTEEEEEENSKADLELIYRNKNEIYEQEAEQSRLMMAISAGQENMASFFNLLTEARVCGVAQIKSIEWKLSHSAWWMQRKHHDLLPCMCPAHNRTPLDVIKVQKELLIAQAAAANESSDTHLQRSDTTDDLRALRSSLNKMSQTRH